MLLDAQGESATALESKKFEKMLKDHHKSLYPDYKMGHKKLRNTLELLQCKATNGVSDKGFEELLKIVKNMFPEDNILPSKLRRKMLFALWDWWSRRSMHVITYVSCTMTSNMGT